MLSGKAHHSRGYAPVEVAFFRTFAKIKEKSNPIAKRVTRQMSREEKSLKTALKNFEVDLAPFGT